MLNEKKVFFNNDNNSNRESSLFVDQHKIWKEGEKKAIRKYYLLFNGIDKYLPFIGKAMPLYTLYCLYSKNETGESFHGIEGLKNDLMVSDRTINNWNKQLEKLGLIKRIGGQGKSTHTFILPTRDYIDSKFYFKWEDDNILADIKDILIKYRQIDFTECNIYHSFEWRKNAENSSYTVPHNALIIALTKNLNGHFTFENDQDKKDYFEKNIKTRNAFVYIEIPQKSKFNISISDAANDFDNNKVDDLKIFETPFKQVFDALHVDGMNIEGVHGVAFNTSVDLKKFKKDKYGLDDIDYLSSLNAYVPQNKDEITETSIIEGGDGQSKENNKGGK